MRTEASVVLLRRPRLFAELGEETLRALAERSVERSSPRHGRLFYQGDPGTGLFMVASGLVKVVVTSEDGEEMVLATLGAGEALGELSIVDGGPRSASAEALEPTVVLLITRDVLLDLATRDGALTEALLRTPASTRCRAVDRWLLSSTRQPARPRPGTIRRGKLAVQEGPPGGKE
jgi:CRP/FNR family cyclic AMP-dependent transcriptional regulator